MAADGRWYACHRAIGQSDYALGDSTGLDAARRRRFVETRHVHTQIECRSCWARYLCSGGCHQEASSRTAASCDFIRSWLDFCLETYCDLGTIIGVRRHDEWVTTQAVAAKRRRVARGSERRGGGTARSRQLGRHTAGIRCRELLPGPRIRHA
ncbi:MAG: SPASM domain-containing protein [Defluviicoccus sp.]|nr:MAG: SPASM domain-containing protein [Defluviicoccus sp.]